MRQLINVNYPLEIIAPDPFISIINPLKNQINIVDLSLYNLYFVPNNGELVTIQFLDGTNLASGRKGYNGETFGANEPVVEAGGVLLCEQYTNELLWSEDLTNAVWDDYGNIILTPTTFEATEALSRVKQDVFTIDGKSYNTSIYMACAVAYYIRQWSYNSESGNYPNDIIVGDLARYNATVLGRSGGGLLGFGVLDSNTEGWQVVDATKSQVTESPYPLPYVKTESTAVTVPENFSDVDRGPRLEIKDEIITALYGTDGTDAQGKLTLPWTPTFAAGDLTGDINILSANNSVTDLLYFDATNNLIKSTDGTNTAEIACSPVSGTTYEISLDYKGSISKMQLSLDGSPGSLETFAGSFPYSTYLNFGYQAEAPQYIDSFNITKLSTLTADSEYGFEDTLGSEFEDTTNNEFEDT